MMAQEINRMDRNKPTLTHTFFLIFFLLSMETTPGCRESMPFAGKCPVSPALEDGVKGTIYKQSTLPGSLALLLFGPCGCFGDRPQEVVEINPIIEGRDFYREIRHSQKISVRQFQFFEDHVSVFQVSFQVFPY